MNRERISSVHEIKSGDPEWNESAMHYLNELFTGRRWWPSQERAKTPQELQIIRTVVPLLEKFLGQFGAKPLQLLAHHIQIVDKTKMDDETRSMFEKRITGEKGLFNVKTQRVGIPDWQVRSGLDFALVLVHELVHFYSYASIGKTKDNELGHVQVGLHIFRGEGESMRQFFADVNEAITEELTRRFFEELRRIPFLREEIDRVYSAREKAGDANIASFPIWEEVTTDGQTEYVAQINKFHYPESRQRLQLLIEEIDVANPKKFKSKDEIFGVFARAAMTGEVKEMANLIEGLGRGRLRDLASRTP